MGSLLSRGAWIEIKVFENWKTVCMSLLSRGAWIEIERFLELALFDYGRSSHEERGLKYLSFVERLEHQQSLLSRGAWIEIFILSLLSLYFSSRSSHEERGLKFTNTISDKLYSFVAPLTRSVD